MLVPFVIDADSLAPDPAWVPAQQRACHNNLLDVWQRFGLLVHDGNTFADSRLNEAVATLPQNLRSLWQKALEHVPLSACGAGWNGSVSVATLPSFAAAAQLAFVDDTRAEAEFGLLDDCDEQAHPVPDRPCVNICRLLAASQAQAFKIAVDLSGAHVEIGTTFQMIWDARFKTLAAAPIKRVCIVDRYAIERHHEPNAQNGLSGLERFIRLLDAGASGPRYVTLYSAWTDGLRRKLIYDVAEDIRLVLGRLAARNIKHIKLFMVPNSGFRDDAHGRFLRFEDYVWDIDLGLEIFEGAFAARRAQASFKTGPAVSGYKRVEEVLKDNAGTKKKEIN